MEYAVSGQSAAKLSVDCVVVVLPKGAPPLPQSLPEDTRKAIAELVDDGDFHGRKGQTLLLRTPAGLDSRRLLLVGSGRDADEPLTVPAWLGLVQTLQQAVAATGAVRAALVLDQVQVRDRTPEWLVRETVRQLADAGYRFEQYKSEKKPASALAHWTLVSPVFGTQAEQACREGRAVAAGMALARDLGNLPPNVCHPEYLVTVAEELADQYRKLKLRVIGEKEAEKLGMGAFCAVARGSKREGQIIVLDYQGAKSDPVALVGKGITFDTGGISLKPGAAMDEMKFDMCGAASVLGTLKTVCELDLPLHLVVVVAAAENMPDGRASRPGDIVTTLSGQTVEILNTDAEGRLVLCDALTYVQQQFRPHTVVDVATLTGACVVALGSQAQAVYANDAELAHGLLDAGDETGDRAWPMPLWDEYQEQLDSPFADMANIGGPKAGSITAACFLSRFAKDVRWAHLDIAGTAWISSGKQKGASGRPVPLLSRYLINLVQQLS